MGKRTRTILSIVLAVVMVATLGIAFARNNEAERTNVGVMASTNANLSWGDVEADIVWERYQMYTWEIDKAVQESVAVKDDESATVEYTLTVTREEADSQDTYTACISGTLSNRGALTDNLVVWAVLSWQKPGGGWNHGSPVYATAEEGIDIDESEEYKICIEFAPVEGAQYHIRLYADADNKSGAPTQYGPVSITIPDSPEITYQNAIISDLFSLDTLPDSLVVEYDDGNAWDLDFDEDFVFNADEDEYIYTYTVTISNNGYDGEAYNLENTVTLKPDGVDEDGYVTASAVINVTVSETEDDDGDECPAAPAVAAAILKEAGIPHRYDTGKTFKDRPVFSNYIAETAHKMGNGENEGGTGFNGVSKCDVGDYYNAVYDYLKNVLGANLN